MNKYDELLKQFLRDDDYKSALRQPNQVGNYVYSTNGHAMLYMHSSLVEGEYLPHEKAPNFQAVIPKVNTDLRFSANAIRAEMLKIEKLPVYGECDKCSGSGGIYCPHCESTSPCNRCDGSGATDQVVGREYSFGAVLEFYKDAYIGCDLFELVLYVCDTEGTDEIKLISAGSGTKVHLFEVGRCKVVIMPRTGEYVEQKISLTNTATA